MSTDSDTRNRAALAAGIDYDDLLEEIYRIICSYVYKKVHSPDHRKYDFLLDFSSNAFLLFVDRYLDKWNPERGKLSSYIYYVLNANRSVLFRQTLYDIDYSEALYLYRKSVDYNKQLKGEEIKDNGKDANFNYIKRSSILMMNSNAMSLNDSGSHSGNKIYGEPEGFDLVLNAYNDQSESLESEILRFDDDDLVNLVDYYINHSKSMSEDTKEKKRIILYQYLVEGKRQVDIAKNLGVTRQFVEQKIVAFRQWFRKNQKEVSMLFGIGN